MSKYQDIMNKIEVTDEMKSRILQNIEKEVAAESNSGENKIRKFDFRRYIPMVAGLAVFIVSAYVVINVIPSHKPAYESTTSAPMAESDSMMYEAEITEEAAEEVEGGAIVEDAEGTAVEAPVETEMAAEPTEEIEAEGSAEMAAEAPAETDAYLKPETSTAAQNNAQTESIKDSTKDVAIEKPASDLVGADKTGGASNGTSPVIGKTEGTSEENAAAIDQNDGSTAGSAVKDAGPVNSAKPGFFGRIVRFFKGIFKAIRDFFR